MTRCKHKKLTLIQPQNVKLRCRRCHLSIDESEIGEDYCPECYESLGIRHRDFERVKQEGDAEVRYRCEDCGGIIKYRTFLRMNKKKENCYGTF